MVQKVNSYTLCLKKNFPPMAWYFVYINQLYGNFKQQCSRESKQSKDTLHLSQQMLADVKCIVQKNLYFSKSSLVHNTVQLLQYKILTSILLCDKLNWLPNVWSHTAVSVLLPVKKTQEIKQQLAEAWQSSA